MNLLAAVRCGEMQPIMLARTVATLDHMLEGRLTINIISSDFPGQKEDSAYRYQRSREVVEILKQAWTQDEINYEGEIYNFSGLTTEPARPYQQNGGPLLYFGGYSPAAVELCAQHCDVYLMWPETREELEAEAREYAAELVSRLDDEAGRQIRERALDSTSLGVAKQSRNRELADMDGFIEPRLWTGVGRARSGCGAALVGSADQILLEIEAYQKMGMRSFIFSGYPHLEECDYIGKLVLPGLKTCSLPHEYGRVPASTPATPLGIGDRH